MDLKLAHTLIMRINLSGISVLPVLCFHYPSHLPLFIVGNKVDLLPRDHSRYLEHVKKTLIKCVEDAGVPARNIRHACLISAMTGFGVESLINKLQKIWSNQGDVYLLGCTNVGKSTLFNSLLQSDYCKTKAVDLIHRATTSLWPGTTLNLLKFPILIPSKYQLYMRTMRLKAEQSSSRLEEQMRKEALRKTGKAEHAVLIGHIGRTFCNPVDPSMDAPSDPFSVNAERVPKNSGVLLGTLDPERQEFVHGKWCYDTPGTVNKEQIINILTTEELRLTLPKQLVYPRTFTLKEGMTLFLAGLGRIDYVKGELSVRFTVFASRHLPITVVNVQDADDFYEKALGTELLRVPCGGPSRLELWPDLKDSGILVFQGIDYTESCADIMLSSAGWVAITPEKNKECKLRVYTPEGRGIYVRQPALLPFAVRYTGRRIQNTPACRRHRQFMD